jgi:hypothetical protein
MIEFLKRYEAVNEFSAKGDSLFVLSDKFICRDSVERVYEGLFYCIRRWKEYLLTQNKEETNLIVLNKSLDKIHEISGEPNYALWLLTDTGLIPAGNSVFRLNDDLKLTKTNIEIFSKSCNREIGIRRAKNAVLCDDYNTNTLKWRFELGENTKVEGDFFLFDKIVVFSTSSQNLIGLDTKNGKELWRLSKSNLHYQMQPSKNLLVGLASNSQGDNFFQVVDPLTGERMVDKSFNKFFYETNPSLACVSKDHYYFISNIMGDGSGSKSTRENHLGCINLRTHEIEWIKKIVSKDEYVEFKKPEYNDGKLYLLDGNRTLHIYLTTE